MAFLGSLLRQGTEAGLGALAGRERREKEEAEAAKQSERDAMEMAIQDFRLTSMRRGASDDAMDRSNAAMDRGRAQQAEVAAQEEDIAARRRFAEALVAAGRIEEDKLEAFAAMPVDQQESIVNSGLAQERLDIAGRPDAPDPDAVNPRLRDAVSVAIARWRISGGNLDSPQIDIGEIAASAGVSPEEALLEFNKQAGELHDDDQSVIFGGVTEGGQPPQGQFQFGQGRSLGDILGSAGGTPPTVQAPAAPTAPEEERRAPSPNPIGIDNLWRKYTTGFTGGIKPDYSGLGKPPGG